MRIYPSKHKIKSIPTSKIDTDLNIPLAYIDVDYSKYNISKIVEPNFSVNNKTILYPEQKFENKDFLLFNEFEEEVEKNNVFISTNSGYTFYPSNAIKFIPKKFLWKATVKRNYDYNISNTYDIKIGYEYDEYGIVVYRDIGEIIFNSDISEYKYIIVDYFKNDSYAINYDYSRQSYSVDISTTNEKISILYDNIENTIGRYEYINEQKYVDSKIIPSENCYIVIGS